MDNKDIKAVSGRRKFLVRAGMGSLPVLIALKSKGAWGYSTQNCNLSATDSKMRSVQPDQFEACESQFLSHGNAKQYFKTGPGNGSERKGYFHSASPNYHKYASHTYTHGIVTINEKTLFSEIFAGGFDGTLQDAVEKGPSSLIRDSASLFLHSLFYYDQAIYPKPEAFVKAYDNAMFSGNTDELASVLQMYIKN